MARAVANQKMWDLKWNQIVAKYHQIKSSSPESMFKSSKIKFFLTIKSNQIFDIWFANHVIKSHWLITLQNVSTTSEILFRALSLPDLGFYHNIGTLRALRSLSCKQYMCKGRYSNASYSWTNQSYYWTMWFFKFQIKSLFSSSNI